MVLNQGKVRSHRSQEGSQGSSFVINRVSIVPKAKKLVIFESSRKLIMDSYPQWDQLEIHTIFPSHQCPEPHRPKLSSSPAISQPLVHLPLHSRTSGFWPLSGSLAAEPDPALYVSCGMTNFGLEQKKPKKRSFGWLFVTEELCNSQAWTLWMIAMCLPHTERLDMPGGLH